MTSPISAMVFATGEPAQIRTAANADSKDYNPRAVGDFVPGADITVDVMGFPEGKQMREGLPEGAKGGFTFERSEVPPSLMAMKSRLWWIDVEHVIHSWRKRIYLGEVDGVTLFLAK